jgi:hypothetical protein
VARIRWFLAGAATAAAALVAAPESYNRLRGLLETSGDTTHPPADEAAAFAGYDAPADAARSDEDTAELRLRIDETRQRIRRRAEDGTAAEE